MTTQRKIVKGLLSITGFILGIIFIFNPESVSDLVIRFIGGLLLITAFLRFGILFNEYKRETNL